MNRAIRWRDLVGLTKWEKGRELALPLPWLVLALAAWQLGWWWLGLLASFYFFLTGLRQSHNAQHYAMGLSRGAQDLVLAVLSVAMGASMHAVQVSHLHHHRHCLDEEDIEGSAARFPAWLALLGGPAFLVRLHLGAWRLAAPEKRRWMALELGLLAAAILFALLAPIPLLRTHFAVMLLGEAVVGFFAVWTVHHDTEADDPGRSQRGWINTWLFYGMFYHAEHHRFPAVPTCHLEELARRLDAEETVRPPRPVLGFGARG